jgi:hypothetical protein
MENFSVTPELVSRLRLMVDEYGWDLVSQFRSL